MIEKNIRASRRLESRAEHQDIAAAFQLYKNYLSEDGNRSDDYLQLCKNILSDPKTKLAITKVNFIDFRRFTTLNIDFNHKLTVIVGDNGYGKTTIADGMAKALSWIVANIEKAGGVGRRVVQADININSNQYAEINAEFSLTNKNKYSVSLSRAVNGADQSKDSSVSEIKLLADLYRVLNSKDEINLPVFAYYSVDRSRISTSQFDEDWDGIKTPSRLDAYKDCLDGGASFSSFMEWFSYLDNKASPEVLITQKQVEEFQALDLALKDLIKEKKLSYDSDVWRMYEKKRAEFLPKVQDSFAQRNLDIIKNVIAAFIPEALEIFVTRRSGKPELKIRTTDGAIGVSMLSHGQKSILGMVCDLARRLILLNPIMDNPLSGYGIVIIDEVELHLHPKWQQKILQDLQNVFTGIQFIVTTHSPQILTTVSRENIRIIENTELGCRTFKPEFSPLAHESGDALAKIMGTHREPDLPLQDYIRQYEQFVRDGQEDSPSVQKIRRELDQAGYQIHESDLVTWRFLAARKKNQRG